MKKDTCVLTLSVIVTGLALSAFVPNVQALGVNQRTAVGVNSGVGVNARTNAAGTVNTNNQVNTNTRTSSDYDTMARTGTVSGNVGTNTAAEMDCAARSHTSRNASADLDCNNSALSGGAKTTTTTNSSLDVRANHPVGGLPVNGASTSGALSTNR